MRIGCPTITKRYSGGKRVVVEKVALHGSSSLTLEMLSPLAAVFSKSRGVPLVSTLRGFTLFQLPSCPSGFLLCSLESSFLLASIFRFDLALQNQLGARGFAHRSSFVIFDLCRPRSSILHFHLLHHLPYIPLCPLLPPSKLFISFELTPPGIRLLSLLLLQFGNESLGLWVHAIVQ